MDFRVDGVRSLTCTGIWTLVPTDHWGESLSATNLCTGMVYTGALLAGGGVGLVVGLLARDGLNRAGEGETRGLDGVECVVAIGALHTAGREGDVRDGGDGRDATALSGVKSASGWWAGSGEAEGRGGSVVLRRVAYPCLKAREARCLRNTEIRAMPRKQG